MAKQNQIGAKALRHVQKYFPKVRKVNDADRMLTVEVTSGDVRASARKNHSECAMAIACKRSEHADGVIMSVGTAYVIQGNIATRYSVPERVSREIISFDRGAEFVPGEYKLVAPHNKLGSAAMLSHGNSGDHGKSKKLRHIYTKNIRTILGSDTER